MDYFIIVFVILIINNGFNLNSRGSVTRSSEIVYSFSGLFLLFTEFFQKDKFENHYSPKSKIHKKLETPF